LRTRPQLLAQLKEKLFILWGDLEERRAAGDMDLASSSSSPFKCCIMEYGVETEDGWQGMHKLFQTTIM